MLARQPMDGWRAAPANHRSTARPSGVLLGSRTSGGRRTTTTTAHAAAAPNNDSAARRLLAAALTDPLHDLALDFDRTYLTHRCGHSVPLFREADDGCGDDVQQGSEQGDSDSGDGGGDENARLDRCLLLQREYGRALRRVLEAEAVAAASSHSSSADASMHALDAAVLLSAFVLSAENDDGGDDDGGPAASSPDALLREARAAVDLLGERAVALARGDRSARGLSAAVSEALFGGGGGGGVGGGGGGEAASSSSSTSSSSSAAAASAPDDRCFYDPSNSCALAVLRRILERQHQQHSQDDDGAAAGKRQQQLQQQQQHQHSSLGSPAALALVYCAVAARAGLPAAPLPLPSHTFVRLWPPPAAAEGAPDGPSGEPACPPLPWVVDPYNSGQACTQGVVSARLSRNWGVALDGGGGGGGGGEGDEAAGGGFSDQQQQQQQQQQQADQQQHHHLHSLALVRLLCNLRESSWAPLPLTGRVRWAQVAVSWGEGGGGGRGRSGSSSKRSSSSSSPRRALWPPSSPSPSAAAPHDAVAARLAVRARKGWMGGGGGGGGGSGPGAACPPPPLLAPLAARCVRAVRLLRATLREMLDDVDSSQSSLSPPQQQQLEAALPRLDRDEGYALTLGGLPAAGKSALRAYLERRPSAADAAQVREFF